MRVSHLPPYYQEPSWRRLPHWEVFQKLLGILFSYLISLVPENVSLSPAEPSVNQGLALYCGHYYFSKGKHTLLYFPPNRQDSC